MYGDLAAQHLAYLVRVGTHEVVAPPVPDDALPGPGPADRPELPGHLPAEHARGGHLGDQPAHVRPDPERDKGVGLPGRVPEGRVRRDAQDLAADRRVYLAQQRGTPDLVEYRTGRATRTVEGPTDRLAQRAGRGLDPLDEAGEGEQDFPSHARIGGQPTGEHEAHLAADRGGPERDAVGLRAAPGQPGTRRRRPIGTEEYQSGRPAQRLPSGGERVEHGGPVGARVHVQPGRRLRHPGRRGVGA